MRLTQKNITFYLLDKGFLDPKYFLTGDYTLTTTMSRNSIFKIQHEKDNGLFIKQLVQQDPTNTYLMQKDATSHYLIHKSGLYKETAKYIPSYYGYDPNHHILITEYFKGTKNIHEEAFRTQTISESNARKMAQILATFHFDIRDQIDQDESLQFFYGDLPWILKIANLEDPNTQRMIHNGVIAEVHKNKDLVKRIEEVVTLWERTSLIHGDIKWVNFIVTPEDNEVKLIDWEIADLGDPLWDVAGAMQSYFSSWLLTYDRKYTEYIKTPNTEFLSFESILPVVRIFWEEYAKCKKFSKQERNKKLIITLKFMVMRMIQTAFENNPSTTPLHNNSVKIIRFCDELLKNPEKVAKDWKLLS